MKRLLIIPLVFFAGCGSTDLISDEIGAQKDKAAEAIKNPDEIIDGVVQDQLEQTGIDGQAPPLPGQP